MKKKWQQQNIYHSTVLMSQVIHFLNITKEGTYLDGTIGPGGHARAILSRLSSEGIFFGLDRDEEAIRICKSTLPASSICHLICDTYHNFPFYLAKYKIKAVDGMFLDLGLSSIQLDSPNRGFSYRADGPLDMRFGTDTKITARTIINEWDKIDLKKIFQNYGEERYSGRIATAIVKNRKNRQVQTTGDLKAIISTVIPKMKTTKTLSRIFQALRLTVNRELESLKFFLDTFIEFLKPGGRIVVISYHSLEDRQIKQKFKELERGCVCPPTIPICQCGKKPSLKILTKKPVIPKKDEITRNKRVRSAKLRAGEKIS